MHNRLWYTAPARDWLEGLPIGTGRLAAMVLGTHKRERVALNHEWLWKGTNRARDNRQRAELLPSVRKLLIEGKYEEGTRAGCNAFGNYDGDPACPNRVDPYQPAGDLYLEFNHGVTHDYRRELNLDESAVRVMYRADGKKFTRHYVAHLAEDLILVRIEAQGAPFDCVVWLDRNHDRDCRLDFSATPEKLWMEGNIRDGIGFGVAVQLLRDGGRATVIEGRKVVLQNVRELVLAVNVGTSACGGTPAGECGRNKLPKGTVNWARLLRSHIAEHKRHYGSMALDLPLDEPDLPTDERMKRLRSGKPDPALVLLYFNFGRYLMCASSANATLPANLQGKWNEDLYPAWDCDYHHDINLQMNYWPAEPAGMQKYAEALLQHMERFVPHGRKAARDLYGCAGIWLPIQTDAWGRATPESYGWAVWIGAAAWLAQHMWWHYEYGQDAKFLRRRAYPFLKEVASFYESYLVIDEQGTFQVVPSQSPENRFKGSGDGMPVSLCVSAAMDVELIWDLLTHAVRASEILGTDADRRRLWLDILDRLPDLRVGSKGQLLEWNEEFEEAEPGHRHISHLVGLYPGEQIDPERTPELFAAARRSLELRMSAKGGHTGWSRAWVACCYARLGEGDKAFDHVSHLVTDFATDTLLDLHPPRIFQIEGNLGGVAAVIEMLLQSYHEELHFLPSLPSAWPSGKVCGLRARGGYTVDLEWRNGKLDRAQVTPLRDRECVVKTGGCRLSVYGPSGHKLKTRAVKGRIRFRVRAGTRYVVTSAP